MKFGIDRLLSEPRLRAGLDGRRVALLAHPASCTEDLTHSLDALAALPDVKLSAAFGPQHGLRGDVAIIWQKRGNDIDRAGTLLERDLRLAVGLHAAKDVVYARRSWIVVEISSCRT